MNSKSYLISVIVPIYGVEQYLVQCIESIICQTYQNLEIILVNDGSEDNCAAICDYYASLEERINVIHKPNGGLVSARKEGLAISKGHYIGYVDGDDWVEPEMFEDMMKWVLLHNVDVVVAGHKEELNNNVVEVLLNSLPEGLYVEEELNNTFYSKMLNTGSFSQFGIYSYLWNKMFKREVLFKNQMAIDDRIFMAEDAACTYPTLLDAKSIYISNSTHYRYRQRIDSMVKTRVINNSELERYNLIYNHLYTKFNSSPFAKVLIPQLDLFLLSLLTVRSDLDFNDNLKMNQLFVFGEVPLNSKIVVCGAGTFGQHLVKRIKTDNNFKLVGWVDNLSEGYKNEGLNVELLSEVKNISFDFVLIAFIDEIVADKMKQNLLEFNIEESKILKVTHYLKFPISDLLERFGIEKLNKIEAGTYLL